MTDPWARLRRLAQDADSLPKPGEVLRTTMQVACFSCWQTIPFSVSSRVLQAASAPGVLNLLLRPRVDPADRVLVGAFVAAHRGPFRSRAMPR